MGIHIDAPPGAVARTVLLPGDPLRARHVAETYLDDVVQYNHVRGMLGFTGTYRGHPVSVQGTGMGVPSACIYAEELIREHGVQTLIRVGSAGAIQPHLRVRDVVIALAASTDSGIVRQRFGHASFAATASFELLEKAVVAARAGGVAFHAGSVLTCDQFYPEDEEFWKPWARYGVLCVEMETAGIYMVAARHGVQALSLLTISDSLLSGQAVDAAARERTLDDMIEIALGTLGE